MRWKVVRWILSYPWLAYTKTVTESRRLVWFSWCTYQPGVKFYPHTHCVIFCNNPFLNGGSINLKKKGVGGGRVKRREYVGFLGVSSEFREKQTFKGVHGEMVSGSCWIQFTFLIVKFTRVHEVIWPDYVRYSKH